MKALAAAALEVVLTSEGFRQPVLVEVGNPFQSARSRPGLRADLCVLLESIGCVQLAWELESSAAALPVSSGFNKESHLYSLLQPNPVSNLSQGTLQIYYFFADSKCLDGF